jgi:hypothetical protein
VYSKDFEARSHRPVEEWRLLQVADAIRVESHPIVAEQHFAGGLGMNGVGVIQERRPKKRGAVCGKPEQKKGYQADRRSGENAGFRRHAAAMRKALSSSKENPVLVA